MSFSVCFSVSQRIFLQGDFYRKETLYLNFFLSVITFDEMHIAYYIGWVGKNFQELVHFFNPIRCEFKIYDSLFYRYVWLTLFRRPISSFQIYYRLMLTHVTEHTHIVLKSLSFACCLCSSRPLRVSESPSIPKFDKDSTANRPDSIWQIRLGQR